MGATRLYWYNADAVFECKYGINHPLFLGPTAFRNWTPFHVKVSTTDAADMTSEAVNAKIC